MLRTARIAPGGVIFHALNRANARATIFEDDDDFMAFERVMDQAVAVTQMRILGYLIMPNHCTWFSGRVMTGTSVDSCIG